MCPELPALLLWKVAKAESPVGRWFIHVYPIYSEFSHEKWWFSIVMLVYQRVSMFIPFMIPSFTEFHRNPKSYPGARVRNHPQDSWLSTDFGSQFWSNGSQILPGIVNWKYVKGWIAKHLSIISQQTNLRYIPIVQSVFLCFSKLGYPKHLQKIGFRKKQQKVWMVVVSPRSVWKRRKRRWFRVTTGDSHFLKSGKSSE